MNIKKKQNLESLFFSSRFYFWFQLIIIFLVMLGCTVSNHKNEGKKKDELYKIDVEAAIDKTVL